MSDKPTHFVICHKQHPMYDFGNKPIRYVSWFGDEEQNIETANKYPLCFYTEQAAQAYIDDVYGWQRRYYEIEERTGACY
jgi:hypothetical protein